jgi:hypothetical protein
MSGWPVILPQRPMTPFKGIENLSMSGLAIFASTEHASREFVG